ncbi:hypothetical protein AB0758_27485 [Tolypothrix bouteillei VB521301_2]|uniref:hypothetical protein n=1 Tax=Tolypothrix bouteillei TaxID=1246981 RepID=UPI0038B60DF6
MHFQASGQNSIQNDNSLYPQIHANSNYPRLPASICGSKNKISKLGLLLISSCSLASAIIGLGNSKAAAQLTIQSTGTLSGTIQLPSFNPNFNNRITRVDTDSNGTYMRNIGTKQNPNFVPVYTSNYVKVQTRADGSLGYYVDFRGIPVISLDGVLSSPALSGGQLEPYKYQGIIPDTKFQGVVQDEFGLTKAFYTGVVTDPKTGQQYQGTFEVNGQGPRYSDRNGGESPTVFDFKSDLPGKPTVTSLKMTNSPLVRLTIKVPADAKPIVSNPTPVVNNPTPSPSPVVSNPTPPSPSPVVSNPTPSPSPGGEQSHSIPIASGEQSHSIPIVGSGEQSHPSPSPRW